MIAEQISHHPPVSAFYLCDRVNGWSLNATVEFDAKFWGTSVGAVLVGYGDIKLFRFNESYRFTFPTVVAKGYVFPPLTMEYDGRISFTKAKSDLRGNIDFKLKPFFGGSFNQVVGALSRGRDTLYSIQGSWDRRVTATRGDTVLTLWDVSKTTPRLTPRRFVVPLENQERFESAKYRHSPQPSHLSPFLFLSFFLSLSLSLSSLS